MSNNNQTIRTILQIHTEQVGSRSLYKLKAFFGSYEAALLASDQQLKNAGLNTKQIDSIRKRSGLLDRLETVINRLKIRIVERGEADFPLLLTEIPDPPELLYVRGELPRTLAVSIVGSRKYTPYGQMVTEELATGAAQLGLTVVSGLALGIDSIAHQAVVTAAGLTVGVLACGVEQIYPSSHRNLAERMIAIGGGVVSEFPLFTPSYRGNFPLRNRIIAGLSKATLVTEARLDSGALLTARLAVEYNRDVFAVPGDIYKPTSAGPNALLKMGAVAICDIRDIADYYALRYENKAQPITLNDQERLIVETITADGTHIDYLSDQLNLDISELGSIVVMLEMKGAIKHEGAGVYRRIV